MGAVDDYFGYFDAVSGPAPEWAEEVRKKFALFLGLDEREGGIKPLSSSARQTAIDFSEFVSSRESVRSFSDQVVPLSEIEAAATLASTSPSVCNRQGALCRIVPRGPEADRMLKHQNGNKGFGSDASHVLLITHDLRTMLTPGERNQAYVDGGLYAMTLLYALHARGIGACCLNWSATKAQDFGLRREINLPDHELVIMMIAVGYPADDARVTVSPATHGPTQGRNLVSVWSRIASYLAAWIVNGPGASYSIPPRPTTSPPPMVRSGNWWGGAHTCGRDLSW